VFYEITNVECVYSSKTTIFIGRIYSIFYIRHNYMFRPLIMAILRLYTEYLLSSIQNIHGLFTWGREGVNCGIIDTPNMVVLIILYFDLNFNVLIIFLAKVLCLKR
jgi:hypothetical protein